MAFFDNIRFPFFTLQELNLDWILTELKRISGFMPEDGEVGDVLTRKSSGAEWEPPEAVNINIDALPQDTQIMDNDQLIFYDISAEANRKIKPPDLLDSMCSNGTPYMNGTASAGTSKKPSRYDHVHPVDTSRQAALSGAQMNAVNSGAPAGCFSGGKLAIANGGTGASTAAQALTNLGAAPASALGGITFADIDIEVGASVNLIVQGTGACAAFLFSGAVATAARGIISIGAAGGGGAVTYTVLSGATALTLSASGRVLTITNNAASAVHIGLMDVYGSEITFA